MTSRWLRGMAPLKIARGLCLAAAPVFAGMAVLTAGAPDMICAHMGSPLASSIGGMAPMYLLMAVVHAAPWLRLLARPS